MPDLTQPMFHEPVFNEMAPTPIAPYFSEPHPSDNAVYTQISELYQIPLRLTHWRGLQGGDFLIHGSKHEEACDGCSG